MRPLLLLALLLPQEKVTLGFKPAKGMKVASTESLSFKLHAKVVVNGDEYEEDVEVVRTRKSTTEFADVVDGRLARKVLAIEEDLGKARSAPDEDFELVKESLHAKTITVTEKEGKPVIECAEKLDAAARASLRLPDDDADLWPGKEVAVGASWTVTKPGVFARLYDVDEQESTLTLTLKELKQVEKRACAVVTLKGEVKVKTRVENHHTLTIEGELLADVETGIVLSLKASGKAVMKRAHETIKADGEGTVTLERTSTIK